MVYYRSTTIRKKMISYHVYINEHKKRGGQPMKTALKRVASLLMALIMILEVVAPGVVEARSANQNRATVSDDVFIPPDGNRIDPDQNSGSHLPNFIDPDDDGYYTPPQKTRRAPAKTPRLKLRRNKAMKPMTWKYRKKRHLHH